MLSAELRKELYEVGQRTSQVEKKMDKFAEAHNSLADKLQEMEAALQEHKLKLVDIEDRIRRNNLRIRGIPESVLPSALNTYLLDFFQAFIPEIHPDQLLIDRAHRLRRPQHLPTTAARDVIVRVHFFHAKERLARDCRAAEMLEPYQVLKIFTDLSAVTLQFRKRMAPITAALRTHRVAYRWGFPAKLLISYKNGIH
ncbi:Hypothetical predicted protein [Pelobates cultripes]|uniref:Uncharacterized protein n=1 Tax=Pelobates cultripes TaxID=61616 RepID=A0AAD1VZJ2_PELCU|nr:Hypothetical predicted protein [Pelobates cultripes]